MFLRVIVLAAVSLTVSACGIFGGGKDDDIVFDQRTGPNTKQLVEDLPDGLVGDEENARYTNDELRAEEPSD